MGWKNLWSLTVLVFLRLKPMHPYEMQSVIKLTHKDDFLRLKSGSIYNSIVKLLKAGLIRVGATTRSGRRPERTVYQITPQGARELSAWLSELLEDSGQDTTSFYAALSFLPALEPAEVRLHLERRFENLGAEVSNLESVLKNLVPKIGRLVLLEVEYALATKKAERRWITKVIADLKAGRLHWDASSLRERAAHFFCQNILETPPTKGTL